MEKLTCNICGYTAKINPFARHLHKHGITSKEFYDMYMKKSDEGFCKNCNKETAFRSLSKGYLEFCSCKCSNADKQKLEKQKETNRKNLGVDFPSQSKEIREKYKKTCLKRYGTENPLTSLTIRNKIKQNNKEKYGTEEHLASKDIREKIKSTCLEKYGVESVFKLKDIQEKIKENIFKKYGVINPGQIESAKEKIKNTCLKRYGCSSYFKSLEYKEKQKELWKNERENRYSLFKTQLLQKRIEIVSTKEEFISEKTFKLKCLSCDNEFESENVSIQKVVCECTKNISTGENDICDWLKTLGVVFKQSDRTILYPQELDIYIPEYKIAIEFNGLYWHSDIHKSSNYHLDKTLKCKEKGIELIHIFENEWENKQDIVKSIILSKLGIYEKKIQARKCIIKEVINKDYKEFVELNHLQGYVPSKYKIGLYFEDELVQICSFGRNRFKKDEVELIRSCSKLNYSVMGGFDKLVQYFIKTYSPVNLISYVDRRYFNGNGYKKWKLITETKPNYWYWHKNNGLKVYSRLKFQKHKLFNLLENFNNDLSEAENMYNNNYMRIWDCGNLKFKYIGEKVYED